MYRNYVTSLGYQPWYLSPYNGFTNSYRRRDLGYWSPYDYWFEYFYSSDEESEPEADPVIVPEEPKPPKEELAKVLKVKKVDLMIAENAVQHHTDRYDCTEERVREGDTVPKPAECVIRRGQSMKIKVTFDREYVKEKNDMSLKLQIGDKPTDPKGTQAEFDVDEEGKEDFKEAQKWGAKLVNIQGNTIELEVFIPANCIVGKWNLSMSTASHGKDENGKDVTKKFTYKKKKNPMYITILFNPWCRQDLVHTAEDKDEYILNEFGFIYSGSSYSPRAKPWVFGQFKDQILEASLKLLDEGFTKKEEGKTLKNYKPRWNPVAVCRKLAAMVNMSEWGDKGVLVGNWSGKYEDGTSPMAWIGSVNILRQYLKTGEPVLYGQCWVFSGVLTTVCRALGIPCRSVTNFDSAHDTDTSNTIDYFYKNRYQRDDNLTHDSIWNFHVWNEVYIKRPDLDPGHDGWQALDSTPQEESDGVFTCGPTSIIAVKKGEVNINYDTSFVFSEVNADKVNWERAGPFHSEEWIVRDIQKAAVGKKISTKMPGVIDNASSEEFRENRRDFTRQARKWRLDLTNQYKYPEGSEEERKAVAQAYKLALRPRKRIYNETRVKPLTIEFMGFGENDEPTMIGDELRIIVKVTNPGNFGREVDEASLHLFATMYTGGNEKEFDSKIFEPMKVESKSSKFLSYAIQFDQYYPHLLEDNYVHIFADLHVKPIASEAEQDLVEDILFQFEKPDLYIKGSTLVKKNEDATFTITFENPLPIPLTECKLSVMSGGFENVNNDKVEDVPARGPCKHTVLTKAERKGDHPLVFELMTKELYCLDGFTNCAVDYTRPAPSNNSSGEGFTSFTV